MALGQLQGDLDPDLEWQKCYFRMTVNYILSKRPGFWLAFLKYVFLNKAKTDAFVHLLNTFLSWNWNLSLLWILLMKHGVCSNHIGLRHEINQCLDF